MKKILLPLSFLLIIIAIMSCDDNVNPKTEFKEVYALNCIIRGYTTLQLATITNSYDVDGFDPLTNTNDPFIKGAKIKLYYQATKQTFTFRDTSVAREAGSRYSTPMSYYYLKNFRPPYESSISIEATLPNGKILTANAMVLFVSPYVIEKKDYTIPNPNFGGKYLNFTWSPIVPSTRDEKVYYVPELIIKYAKTGSGGTTELQKKVPFYYINTRDGEVPLYPSIASNFTSASFDTSIIRRSLEEISDGDPNKGNYIIHKATFRLLIADKNLAVYYAAQKTFLDEFSVRVTQPEFTNINGGLGIFGTLNSSQIDVKIDGDYIRKLGYRAY